jgi:ABC-type multidrug transport system fused ATPase/permease subunit
LDEPTSALDQSTEMKIMRTINEWLHDGDGGKRTSIFIAHRLSTISDCDVIYVLDKGRVVEQGSHHQLLQLGGMYATMWESQSKHHSHI